MAKVLKDTKSTKKKYQLYHWHPLHILFYFPKNPSECYRTPVSHKHSNDWTQYPTTISDASSSLFSPPPSERSRLMLGNVYSSEVSLRHRGPLPVNYQRVTPTRGQFPIVFSFSRGTDWPNQNENLPSNKHQTDFSRFENVSVGNKTQAASPSLGVRPLAPPCEVSSRYHTRFSYQHSAILFKHDFRKCSPSYFH